MLMMTFSPISSRPSTVAEPMCGSITTFGASRSRGLISCPCSNTSSPAPASSPARSIRVRAFSSITSPREVFTITAEGFISFSRRAFSRWKVEGVCGALIDRMSTRASIWSRLSHQVAFRSSSTSGRRRRRLW